MAVRKFAIDDPSYFRRWLAQGEFDPHDIDLTLRESCFRLFIYTCCLIEPEEDPIEFLNLKVNDFAIFEIGCFTLAHRSLSMTALHGKRGAELADYLTTQLSLLGKKALDLPFETINEVLFSRICEYQEYFANNRTHSPQFIRYIGHSILSKELFSPLAIPSQTTQLMEIGVPILVMRWLESHFARMNQLLEIYFNDLGKSEAKVRERSVEKRYSELIQQMDAESRSPYIPIAYQNREALMRPVDFQIMALNMSFNQNHFQYSSDKAMEIAIDSTVLGIWGTSDQKRSYKSNIRTLVEYDYDRTQIHGDYHEVLRTNCLLKLMGRMLAPDHVNEMEKDKLSNVGETSGSETEVPTSVSEIPNFPFKSYKDLVARLKSGSCHIHPSFTPTLYSRFAPGLGDRALFTFFSLGFWVLPLVGVILAFFDSFWFLSMVLFAPIAFSQSKRRYNKALVDGIFRSEESFCFLYRFRQIALSTGDYRDGSFIQYYWGKEKEQPLDYAAFREKHKSVFDLLHAENSQSS